MERVFISTTSFGQFSKKPLEILRSNNFDVTINPFGRKLTKAESLELYHEFDGIIAGTEIFDKDVLDAAKKLKVISRVGVGLDNIDLEYARQKGIEIKRSQTQPSLAVAELVLGIILDLIRKISIHNQEMKEGIWNKKMGALFSEKTLGIIGLGNIGKTLIKITQGFGLNYLAYDIYKDEDFSKTYNVKYCDLKTLLKKSDVISIHLTLNNKSIGMISENELELMKDEAILVNASRGEIINEDSLIDALSKNIIGGAGLDVYQTEPYAGPLTDYDNVVLTPHIASYAKEIRVAMELEAVNNLLKEFNIINR